MNGALLLKQAGAAGKLQIQSVAVTQADRVTPLPGIFFGVTDFYLGFNTTGAEVPEFSFIDPEQFEFIALKGDLDLAISVAGLSASLTGLYEFQKSATRIDVAVSSASTSFTAGSESSSLHVAFEGIAGVLTLTEAGAAGKLAVDSISLTQADGVTPLPGIVFEVADFYLEFNTTGGEVIAPGLSYTDPDHEQFISLSGELEMEVTVDGVSASVTGGFDFEIYPDQVLVAVSEAGTSLSVGEAPGGVQVSFDSINGALLLLPAGTAGKLSIGEIALTRADGVTPLENLSFSAVDFSLGFNTTGEFVALALGEDTVFDYSTEDQRLFLAMGGKLNLSIALGSVTSALSGTFGFRATGSDIEATVSDGGASLSVGNLTVTAAGIGGAFRLVEAGAAGLLTVQGITISGLEELGISGAVSDAHLAFNTTGGAILDFVDPSQFQFFRLEAAMSLRIGAGAAAVGVQGSFGFEKSTQTLSGATTEVIKVSIGGSDGAGTPGAGAALQAGEITLTASGITGAFLAYEAGMAGKLSVALLELGGLDLVDLRQITLEFNTTGSALLATIGGVKLDFSSPEKHDFLAFSFRGKLTITAGSVATKAEGAFGMGRAVQPVNGVDTPLFLVWVSDLELALAVGQMNEVYVSATGIDGALLALDSGIAGKLTVEAVTFDGLGDELAFAAEISNALLEFNTTGQELSGQAGDVELEFVGPERSDFLAVSLSTELDLLIGGVGATVSGRFAFEKTTRLVNGVQTDILAVALTDGHTSLTIGAAPEGVQVAFTDLNGAFLIRSGGGAGSAGSGAAGKFAVGAITVTRADAVTPLESFRFTARNISLAFNTTDAAVVAEIGGVSIDFSREGQERFFSIGGTLDLGIADFITLTGSFGFQKAGSEIHVVAEGVDASLRIGSFQAGIQGGTLALLISPDGTIALDASGALVLQGAGFASARASEVRVQFNNTGVDFSSRDPYTTLEVAGVSATLQMGSGTVDTPLARVNVTGLQADLIGLVSVAGNFSFEAGITAGGTPAVKVAASLVEIYLGDGTTDYVWITNGHGGMVVTKAGLACRVEAAVSLLNVPGLDLSGTLGLAINTGPDPVKESFLVGTEAYSIDLPGGPFVSAEGDPVSLTLTGVDPQTTLSGRIAFQQSTDSEGGKVVIIAASQISVTDFTGTGTDPESPLDISNARGTLVIMGGGVAGGGVAGSLSFESDVAIGGVEAGAEFKLVMSDIEAPVDLEGPFGSIHFDPGPFILIEISDLTISFPGVEIEGDFSFRQATKEDGSTIEVIIGNNVRVFVGDNTGEEPIGLELSQGKAIFLRSGDADAGFVSGRVELLGVEGLVLSATLTVRINESSQPLAKTTFYIDEEQVSIEFTDTEVADAEGNSFIQFGGSEIQLSVLNTVELRGNLTFTRKAESFLIGAAGVQAFIGDGPAWDEEGHVRDDATGVLVKNITLGMAILPGGKFAFAGEGELTFLGLSGLTVTGLTAEARLGVRLNRSGGPLDLIIPVLGHDDVPLNFDDASDAPEFKGELTIGYSDVGHIRVFELAGTVSFRQLPAGGADVSVESASLEIYSGDEVAFGIEGEARFKIGGQAGFRLQDFAINGVSIFGTELSVPSLPSAADPQPTADLVSLYDEESLELADLNSRGYIDVMFNDPNGAGIDPDSIDGDELKILFGGEDITASIGFLSTPMKLHEGIFRYPFSGSFASAGQYTVEFVADSWRDDAATNYGLGETEHFVLLQTQTGQVPRAPPAAQLANPAPGSVIAPEILNNRRYIDVVFSSRSGDPIDPSSIDGDEFSISGAAVLGAKVRPGAPVHLFGDTYRYFLMDANPNDAVDLFGPGELRITFAAGGIVAGLGTDAVGNLEKTETVTLDADQPSGTETEGQFSLGPLTLQGPSISIEDFGFADSRIILTVSLGLDTATLSFAGAGSSGISAELSGINFTFDLGIGLPGSFSFSPTGRFSFSVTSLEVSVPELLEVEAEGIFIHYDPAGGADQELLRIETASVTVPIPLTSLELTGSIRPYDPDPDDPNNPLMPGLVVRMNGFAIGEAELKLGSGEKITLGSILEIEDLRVGIAGFGVNFDPENPIVFSGSIFFASGGAAFLPGKPFNASISDRDTPDDLNSDGSPNDEALRADITFDEFGRVEALLFDADTLTVELGGVLTLSAQDFNLDTGAEADERIVSFGVIGARLAIGSLEIGGEARNFGFTASGEFVPGHPDHPDRNFAVVLSAGGTDGSAVGWPEWLPVRIDTLGVEFPVVGGVLDFSDPILLISASVTGIPGAPGLEFSGVIEGVKIRPALLLQGKFPVIDIESIGVGVRGEMFGGSIDAALIGGILKIKNGAIMSGDGDPDERILFMGLQGGFEFPGVGGLTIRLALSELGPLGVFVSASVPGGIVIEPNTGLAFNDFSAGVEFFKSLPSVDDPALLRQFGLPTETTPETWLTEVKNQVVNQYNAIQAMKALGLPGAGGFFAAFTSPMVITGGAKVFTIYTSKEVFNGEVFLQFSTDGKFLIIGKLNFAADMVSISGRLYADLSNVAGGNVTVLFLADVPEQVRLLTVEGKLSLGFSDAGGNEVEVPVVNLVAAATDARTTADLAFPAAGEEVDAGLLNNNTFDGRYYVDLQFRAGAAASLSYGTILDQGQEFSLTLTAIDGSKVTVGIDPVPLPVEVAIDEYGLPQYTILTDFDYAELKNHGIGRFRYLVSDVEFQWVPGTVEVALIEGSWLRSDGAGNEEDLQSFTVAGPAAKLANPAQGGKIRIGAIRERMSLDVIFLPSQTSGATIELAAAPIPILSGDGTGTATVASAELLAGNGGPSGSQTYRYHLEGSFSLGEVTLAFAAGSFADSAGLSNTAQIMGFAVVGATADLRLPLNGSCIGLGELTVNPFIDVAFTPGAGAGIDENTLSDDAPEIRIFLSNGVEITVAGKPDQDSGLAGTNVYRYELDGALVPGPVTVTFLAASFADNLGVTNLEDTEIFYIEQPAATLANLTDGNTFQLFDINSADSDLYAGEEGLRYIEVVLTPTSGADVDASTVEKGDLIIEGSSFGLPYQIVPTGVQRVGQDGVQANRFRFYYDGVFLPGDVSFFMAEGAWKDTLGNESAILLESVSVRLSLAVTLEIEGRAALYAADLLEEPIFEISGYVNLQGQAAVEGGGSGGTDIGARLLMDFGGTCKLVYIGNIASAAGRFILDVRLPAIGAAPEPSEDAVTVGELLGELGIGIPEDHFAYDVELPRFWGVVKLETNFAVLQEIGIDLKGAALLEVNATKTVKTETLTLEGIPGDVEGVTLSANGLELGSLVDQLDSGGLPTEIVNLFTDNDIQLLTTELRTVVSGVLWRVIDSSGKQFYVQLRNVSAFEACAPEQLEFCLRTETQTFELQPMTLLIQAFGRAVFRLPPFANPQRTEPGPVWFRETGAFSLKLSVDSLEIFVNGQLTFSPAGYEILDIRCVGALLVERPILQDGEIIYAGGIAGHFKLGGTLTLPGVLLSGTLEAYLNTFGVTKDIPVPSFLKSEDAADLEAVSVYAAMPVLNPDYDPYDAQSPILVEETGGTPGPYLVTVARADLNLLDVLVLQGGFRFAAGTSGVEVQAGVGTVVGIPGTDIELFDLTGTAAFALDADGFYGHAALDLDVGSADLVPGLDPEFELTADFLLEFNTASIAKEIQTFAVDTSAGQVSMHVVCVTLPAATLRLAAAGTLTFSLDDGGGVELTGRFDFFLSSERLTISAEARATVAESKFVAVAASGALEIASWGLGGYVRLDAGVSSGEGLSGIGFDFSASGSVSLYINTCNEVVTVEGVAIDPGVRLEASGSLRFTVGGVVGFLIEGEISTNIDENGGEMSVDGLLLAELGSVRFLQMGVDGDLILEPVDIGGLTFYAIAGVLELTALGPDSPLQGTGFSLDAELLLEVNTTGMAYTDPELEAGFYARIWADGDLLLAPGGTGFKLDGYFYLELSEQGLLIDAEADLVAMVADAEILKLYASGQMLVNGSGLAGRIKLTAHSAALLSSGTIWSFGGTFLLEVNTTNAAIDTIGKTVVDLPAGPYVRLDVEGHLQLLTYFRMDGGFTVEAGSGGLQIGADATLRAVVGSTTLLSVDAVGAMLLANDGIAAKIALDSSAGISGTGFYFAGEFTFILNTTDRDIHSIAGRTVRLSKDERVRIHVAGSLEVLNLVSLSGNFDLSVDSAGLRMEIDARMRIFRVSFDVYAEAVATSSGFALKTELKLSAASAFIPFTGIQIKGTLFLEINTTSRIWQGIPARTARVTVSGAEFNVLGFKLKGSLKIEAGSGGFRIEIPNKPGHRLTLDLGPIHTEFHGYLDSNGTFSFTATAGFHATVLGAYLDATASVTLGSSLFRFYVSGSAGLEVMGIRIGVDVEGSATITGKAVSITVRGSVNTIFGPVYGPEVTFSLGSIDPPPPPQVDAVEPVLATRLSDGTLRLNMGNYAWAREVPESTGIQSETYEIRHVGGLAGSETVRVYAFRFSQIYRGVKRIMVYDAGSGSDTIRVQSGVLSDAQINAGDGHDTVYYAGSGSAVIDGGTGNDVLTVVGGKGHTLYGGNGNDRLVGGTAEEIFYGGEGSDTILAGGGNDTLYGGAGADMLYGQGGDDRLYGGPDADTLDGGDGNDTLRGEGGDDTIAGGNGTDLVSWTPGCGADTVNGGSGSADRLEVALGDSADTVIVSATSNGFRLSLPGEALTVSGIGICDLETGGGADTVVVSALSASQLGRLGLSLGDDSVRDAVSFFGTPGADAYSLSVSSGAVEITRVGGTAVTINQAGSSHGASIIDIHLGEGDDSLDIHATLAESSTAVFAGPGSDTIRIGGAGNVNGIVEGIFIDGQLGSDTLNVIDGDQDGPENVLLTATSISGLDMDSEITYAGVEFLNLLLGNRPDTVNIRATNASTITAVYAGGGDDLFNVGSAGGGVVSDLAGKLVLDGQEGEDALNLDDSDAAVASDGTLTSTTIGGLGMGEGIEYRGLESLDMLLAGGTLLVDGAVPVSTVISSGGSITVQKALGPEGSIALDAAGGIAAGEVQALELNLQTLGDVADLPGSVRAREATLTAVGDITLGPVVCQELVATAGGAISLETTAGTLEAVAEGDIAVVESDSIVLGSLISSTGSITVSAGGNITDLAGSIQGRGVHLTAVGSITAGPVVAEELVAEAGGTLILETEVGSIQARAGGDLFVTEKDAILLSRVGSEAGSVTVTAGGTITAREVAAAEAVSLEADAGTSDPGHVRVQGSIQAGNQLILTAAADILIADASALAVDPICGTALLTAGGIVHSGSAVPVLAHTLRVSAESGIHLPTEVSTLFAVLTGAGDIWVEEIDALVLSEVVAPNGAVRIIAGNAIAARYVASLTDRPGASVALIALQGDILIDTIAVGDEFGQVSLCATGGDIREVEDFDAATDLFGHLGILYAAGQIGSAENPNLDLETGLGEMIVVTGPNLDLHIDGDVELFFLVEGRIRVTATGTIRALYLESITGDIRLRAFRDIEADYARAGDDLRLCASGSIRVSGETVWGDSGSVTAADDLSLWAGEDVVVAGEATAGDDVSIGLCRGNLAFAGTLAAGDDMSVGVCRGNLTFAGTITAGDDVSIGLPCGELVFAGTVAAGDDARLEAGSLSFSGTISAGGDVGLASGDGDIIFEGTIDAGESVCIRSNLDPMITGTVRAGRDLSIWSDTDVVVNGSLIAGDDVYMSSCRSDLRVTGTIKAGDDVYLRACRGDMNIEGSIAAGDDLSIDLCRGNLGFTGTIDAGDDVSIDIHRGDLVFGGTITAGDDVSIDVCCGDLIYSSTVTAGDDVSIDVRCGDLVFGGTITAAGDVRLDGANLILLGTIQAGCDVVIRSDTDVVVNGSIAAGRDVWLRSCRRDVQVFGTIQAGDDVHLKACRGDMIIEATIASGDDATLYVCRGNLAFAGTVDGGDDVSMDVCCGDLMFVGTIQAGDDVGIRACRGAFAGLGCIWAGDDIEIRSYWDLVFSGTLEAGDRASLRSVRGEVLLS
jgi:Ca2+-binding RTX toxin-like protein